MSRGSQSTPGLSKIITHMLKPTNVDYKHSWILVIFKIDFIESHTHRDTNKHTHSSAHRYTGRMCNIHICTYIFGYDMLISLLLF